MNNKHRDRLHPPQQGLPHAHHHLHHCGDGCLPSLNPSQSSFSGDGIAWRCFLQRKNALSSQCHCHSKSLTLECAMQTVHQWHFPHRANNRQIGLSALVNLQFLQPDLDQYSYLFIRGNSTSSRVIYFDCRLKHFNTMQKVPADWFISIAGPVKLFSEVTAS